MYENSESRLERSSFHIHNRYSLEVVGYRVMTASMTCKSGNLARVFKSKRGITRLSIGKSSPKSTTIRKTSPKRSPNERTLETSCYTPSPCSSSSARSRTKSRSGSSSSTHAKSTILEHAQNHTCFSHEGSEEHKLKGQSRDRRGRFVSVTNVVLPSHARRSRRKIVTNITAVATVSNEKLSTRTQQEQSPIRAGLHDTTLPVHYQHLFDINTPLKVVFEKEEVTSSNVRSSIVCTRTKKKDLFDLKIPLPKFKEISRMVCYDHHTKTAAHKGSENDENGVFRRSERICDNGLSDLSFAF